MITVLRKIFTNNSTIGQLTFGDFTCWTIEPSERRNGIRPICIPPGVYPLEWRWSEKHDSWVPGLLNVPGRTDIEIHPGNEEDTVKEDSLGCILPGMSHSVDWVSNSKEACGILFPMIEATLKIGPLSISVIG